MKKFFCLLIISGWVITAASQNTFANKIIPASISKEVTTVLSYYPELKNVSICFRIVSIYTPLSTKPTFFSIIKKPARRKYIVTISNQTIAKLRPILFEKLSDSAKIGVLGHELSHVADFQKRNFFSFLRLVLKHPSKKFQDKFEFHTDEICLQHGLGNYLLAWSRFVRNALQIKNWRGADNIHTKDAGIERYMNPDTIEKLLTNISPN